ncbi:MAG: hypothetical protein LQ352_003999 [Teloschistes flavicans]|nr:MAG: hypothetical protein LQ352_003999 [Teloschistes flavicans]
MQAQDPGGAHATRDCTTAHIVYMGLCLINNIIAVANMLLGASAAITALTGIHIIAATFLLPVGVVLYTFVGGIKATYEPTNEFPIVPVPDRPRFLTDYFHTFTILIIACFFTIKAFTIPEIGSIGHLWELVAEASKMDTSFFVKAFAASPSAVVPSYVIGGIAYFAVPWCLGTLMSFVAIGLENQPRFPTFPRRMSTAEVSGGLVLPYAAITIAGKGGAAGILIITFMAVTSTLSAQVIAVSSILSFDIYRTYFNKHASDRDVIRWSHYGVVIFGVFSAAFSTLLHYVGVDLGWTLYILGVLTCPGIFPTSFTILYRRQNALAAIASPLLGMATGLAVWLGSAKAMYGTVTVASTGQILPCVYGTVASAFSPLPYTLLLSTFHPQNYDWADFRREKLAFGSPEGDGTATDAVIERELYETPGRSGSQPHLERWARIAAYWSVATFVGHWVLWPLPMYAAKYVFSRRFFEAWLTVAIVWIWGAMLVAGFFPLVGGRRQFAAVWRALRHGGKGEAGMQSPESGVGSVTPVEVVEKVEGKE